MAGLSEQQRRFADYILEGKTQTEAYELAGYKSKTNEAMRANAARLITNDNVASYIAERQEKAAESAEVTLEWLLDQAKGVLADARSDGSHAAAVSAIKELGVLSGERIEQSKRTNVNKNVDDLTDAELFALLAEGDSQGASSSASSTRGPDSVH